MGGQDVLSLEEIPYLHVVYSRVTSYIVWLENCEHKGLVGMEISAN